MKKFIWAIFFGAFFSNPLFVKNSIKPPDKIIYYELNSLMIERIKAINVLEGNSKSYHFLDSLEKKENFSLKKKKISKKSKDSLIQMISDYSGKNLSKREYDFQKIYNDFVRLNEKIYKEKSKIQDYNILSYNGLLHLANDGNYFHNEYLKEILKGISKLKKLEKFSREAKTSSERAMALTFLRSAEYFPFLYQVSKKNNLEISSLLTILSNESSGYPYILGSSGDINFFQINEKIIPGLYRKLKNEKDSSFFYFMSNSSLDDFKKGVKFSPKENILVGAYFLKTLEKESNNEAQTILYYHLGQSKYKKLPNFLRKRVETGKIKTSLDIRRGGP